jgi:hypothetical protein
LRLTQNEEVLVGLLGPGLVILKLHDTCCLYVRLGRMELEVWSRENL